MVCSNRRRCQDWLEEVCRREIASTTAPHHPHPHLNIYNCPYHRRPPPTSSSRSHSPTRWLPQAQARSSLHALPRASQRPTCRSNCCAVGLHRVRCDHDVVHDAGLMHGTFPVGDDGRGRRHEGHVDHALGAVCRRRGNAYSALPSCRGRAIGRLFRASGHGRQGYSGQQAPQAVR